MIADIPAPKKSSTRRVDVDGVMRGVRRNLGLQSLMSFARTYLAHHFRAEPSGMHEALFAALERLARERSLRLAVAAPRNHAKSTIVCLAFTLWCVARQAEAFIVVVSDTAGQAQDHLAQVKRELEENDLLKGDFPELGLDRGTGRSASGRGWTKCDLRTRPTERQPGGVRILALGAEQRIRGRRNRAERPSLIIGDDLENEDLVRNPERREKRAQWFHATLMKSGSVSMNAVVAGTILHHDSLLARLLDPVKSPGWLTQRFQAVVSWADRGDLWEKWESIFNHGEEWEGATGPAASTAYFEAHKEEMLRGAEALWPAQQGYLALMQMRVRDGRAAFATEMQNEPLDPQALLFRDQDFHMWDDVKIGMAQDWRELVARLRQDNSVSIIGACDPSLGRSGLKGDYSAIVTLAYVSKTKTAYVIGADIRRLRPDALLDAILENDRIFGYNTFAVEAVQFQEMLATQLEQRFRDTNRRVSVRPLTQTQDKVARVQSICPLVTSGGIKFSRRLTLLLEQLKQFPGGAHDDGPDALELALRAAQTPEFYMGRFWR